MANAANEAHLKLLKEQLDRLNPESKAYKKIEAEYARQKKYASGEADHVGPRPRAGGSHGSSRGYSDPFSRGAGSAWAGWDDYVAEGRKDDEFQVKTRLATYGAILPIIGGSAMSQSVKEAEAKYQTKPGTKAHKKRRRVGRAGYAVQGAGYGMAAGPWAALGAMAITGKHATHTIAPATATTAAFGSALGYAYGRRAVPNNTKSKTQKQWVTYKKTSGGTVKTVRRKNPYYMKPRKARGGKKR